MRNRMRLLILVLGLALPLAAQANPIPSFEIFDVVQHGEDVEVAIKVNVPELEGVSLALVRWWDAFQRTVWQVDDVVDATIGDWTWCADPDPAACESAEDCEDCDEDGVPECLDACSVEGDVIAVLDECVPPGCAWYALEEELPQGCLDEEGMDFGFEIEDVSQECSGLEDDLSCDPAPGCGPDADGDTDADTDTDADGDDHDDSGDAADDSGCRAAPARSSRGLLESVGALLFSRG
jgi:hypothetical protein